MSIQRALLFVLLAACDSDTSPTPPPASEPSTRAAAVEESAATPGVEADSEESQERVRPDEVRRLLREGRAALRSDDAATANARFTSLLELAPMAPRFWCEAGFVSFRAGDVGAAARRLDTGLGMLGPPADVSEALREPLAMCLYNRGLVHERAEQPELALRAYEQSLRLRDHAAVVARRDALVQMDRTTPVDSLHVQGIEYSEDGVLRSTDLAAVTRALPAALQGRRAQPVSMRSRSRVQIEGRAAEVFEVDDRDEPVSSLSLLIALPVRGGYRLRSAPIAWTDADGDRSTASVEAVTATVERDLLRVDAEVRTDSYTQDVFERPGGGTCYAEGYTASLRETFTVLCTLDGAGQCGSVRRSLLHDEEARVAVDCEDGEEAVYAPSGAGGGTDYALELEIGDDSRVTLRRQEGTPPPHLQSWLGTPWTLRRWIAEAPEGYVGAAAVGYDEADAE